jgi:hypothetical protein
VTAADSGDFIVETEDVEEVAVVAGAEDLSHLDRR